MVAPQPVPDFPCIIALS